MTGRIGGWAGIVGPSAFVLVFLVEGWLRPGYDPAAEYVSALSLGERGWVQVTNFVVVGVCLLLFAVTVARAFLCGAASRAGPVLFGSIGAGLLLSGPFVMDPAGTPTTAMSGHGLVHGILGGIVFVLMPVTCFVHLRRFGRDPRWRDLWAVTLVLGTFTAVADVVFTVATKVPDLISVTQPWAGLLQRLVLIPFMVWVVVLAVGLLRHTTERASRARCRVGPATGDAIRARSPMWVGAHRYLQSGGLHARRVDGHAAQCRGARCGCSGRVSDPLVGHLHVPNSPLPASRRRPPFTGTGRNR